MPYDRPTNKKNKGSSSKSGYKHAGAIAGKKMAKTTGAMKMSKSTKYTGAIS